MQSVGGEVDTLCGRCELVLAHTILAMVGTKLVRVRCNTCGNDHAFRGGPRSSAAPKAKAARAPRADKVVVSMTDKIMSADASKAQDYSPFAKFAVDQLVRHPTFGLGIVMAVREDKVDIAFKGVAKTLIHCRPSAPAA